MTRAPLALDRPYITRKLCMLVHCTKHRAKRRQFIHVIGCESLEANRWSTVTNFSDSRQPAWAQGRGAPCIAWSAGAVDGGYSLLSRIPVFMTILYDQL